MSHPTNATSTKIRKAKFFPVINGKKRLFATNNGRNGIIKSAPRVTQRIVLVIMVVIIYHTYE
jgi:hypothetical protein